MRSRQPEPKAAEKAEEAGGGDRVMQATLS